MLFIPSSGMPFHLQSQHLHKTVRLTQIMLYLFRHISALVRHYQGVYAMYLKLN
jgi:hypothetical protein